MKGKNSLAIKVEHNIYIYSNLLNHPIYIDHTWSAARFHQISSCHSKLCQVTPNHQRPRKLHLKHCYSFVSTVPADYLAPRFQDICRHSYDQIWVPYTFIKLVLQGLMCIYQKLIVYLNWLIYIVIKLTKEETFPPFLNNEDSLETQRGKSPVEVPVVDENRSIFQEVPSLAISYEYPEYKLIVVATEAF